MVQVVQVQVRALREPFEALDIVVAYVALLEASRVTGNTKVTLYGNRNSVCH